MYAMYTYIDIKAGRQTNRLRDEQTDIETDRQADREKETPTTAKACRYRQTVAAIRVMGSKNTMSCCILYLDY